MKDSFNDIDRKTISTPEEMHALIQAKDWGLTPVGHPETWPQSLRTMVSVMLDNPLGMCIAWGPEFIQLYNDGYRPILGESKHPEALGKSTRETFAEVWHLIGPMFGDVMKGKPIGFPDFMLPLNRNGFKENCYFDFTYSPIKKENGEVGGVLVTVIDTTNKNRSENELKESKQQLEFAIEAAELATWDYNPASQKFTSNDRLKEWFGLELKKETDFQQAINSIVEKDRERVINQIQQSLQYESGGKLDIEYTIVNPLTLQERFLRIKGKASFDENKVGYRLNGTIQDITDQAIARIKLEKSQEQLHFALEGGDLGTFDFIHQEGRFEWSAKTKELFGLPPEATVNMDLYLQALHPEDREASMKMVAQNASFKNGGFYEMEYRVCGITDNRLRWVRTKGRATYDPQDNPVRYSGIVQDITQRKQAEIALKEREETLLSLADNIPQLAWIADAEGNIYWYNKKWYEYTGTSPSQIEGWGWQSIHDPKILPEVLYKWKNSLKTGQSFEMVFPLKGADGNFRQFLTRILPLKNSDGKIYQWFGTNTDITKRMLLEEASKKSEIRFRSLANNMAAYVFIADANANLTFVNNQWLDFIGLKTGEGLGKAWEDVTHPDDLERLQKIYLDAVSNHKSYEIEVRQRDFNGGYRWILWKGVPDISKDGNFQGILGAGIDITDRKNSEQALQKQQAETEKIQRLYEAVTGNTPDLIYIFDLNYCFTYANRALLAMWGKSWEEAIGKSLEENGYEPLHASLHKREIDEVILTTKPVRGSVAFNHAELGNRIYDYIFSPVIDKEGIVIAVAGTARDTTEIRNSEENILKSEQQVRTMVQTAPIPIGVYIGEEMKVQFANQAIQDIWGKGNDVIGKSIKHILPELDNQDVFDHMDSVFKTGIAYHVKNQKIDIETEGKTNIFYFNYSFTPLIDTEGKIYGIINTANDVTDLNLAKLAIQKSEENLRNTILQAPVAMCIFKGENFIVDLANDKMFEFWGKSETSVLNKPIFTGLPEAKEQGFEAILSGVYSSGKTFSADGVPVALPRNGRIEEVYVNFVYSPYRDANGIISGILAVAIDVTAQVTARKIIEDREQKFKALFKTIPHMIWTATGDGRRTYFNNYFLDYTGLNFDDLKDDGWKQIVYPDDLEKELPLWNNSLSTGEDLIIEKRIRQYDGTYRWHLCHTLAQKDHHGNVISWIGTNTEIQEQKIKEQQKDEFISIASHEMKTPLTTAKGYIELVLLSLSEENPNALYVRKALQAVDRLHDLISELLDASKIQNGQLNYTITTFDFNKMVDETIGNMQLTAKNHRLQKEGTILCQLSGDRDRMQQVLINLLSNAIKYSPSADKVIITINVLSGKIQLSVQDFGVGIPRQHLDKIFDRYYRVQEHAVHFQGLGIGLFISSNIIQRHQGRMWVESEPGSGSTFHFTIPI